MKLLRSEHGDAVPAGRSHHVVTTDQLLDVEPARSGSGRTDPGGCSGSRPRRQRAVGRSSRATRRTPARSTWRRDVAVESRASRVSRFVAISKAGHRADEKPRPSRPRSRSRARAAIWVGSSSHQMNAFVSRRRLHSGRATRRRDRSTHRARRSPGRSLRSSPGCPSRPRARSCPSSSRLDGASGGAPRAGRAAPAARRPSRSRSPRPQPRARRVARSGSLPRGC